MAAPLPVVVRRSKDDVENSLVDVLAEGHTIFRYMKIDIAVPAILALHNVYDIQYYKKKNQGLLLHMASFSFPKQFSLQKNTLI